MLAGDHLKSASELGIPRGWHWVVISISEVLLLIKGKGGQNMSHELGSNLTITVMYDNNPYQGGLATAWGFSCLIQGTENTILFDTGGDGSIVLANMEKLGCDPKEIELIVLSHMHWDHIGGVYHFLNKNQQVTLYLPTSFSAHFKDDVKRYGANVVDIREAVRICDQVYSSGELGGKIQEQSLFIQTDKGLIVITGCAHPGIVNIVQKAKELLKDEVLFVMGGFHVGGESEAAIEHVVSDSQGVRGTLYRPLSLFRRQGKTGVQKGISEEFYPYRRRSNHNHGKSDMNGIMRSDVTRWLEEDGEILRDTACL